MSSLHQKAKLHSNIHHQVLGLFNFIHGFGSANLSCHSMKEVISD